MADVYGVFQGQYSDWKCVGCFDDEISAWKYCNLRNQSLDDYDKMYVMPIHRIKCDLSNIPDGYFVYKFRFESSGDGVWRLWPDYKREPDDYDNNERLVEYANEYFSPYINVNKYSTGSVAHVYVGVRETDMQAARTIAYQLMKEYFPEGCGDNG